MNIKMLLTALTLATATTLGTVAYAQTSATASPPTQNVSPLPSRTWVESYPALLYYANVPVLAPSFGSMAKIGSFLGLAGTQVDVNRDGYQVTLAPVVSLPPWTTQQPIVNGARTAFSFSGAKATPSLATRLYLGLPANADVSDLPGLPVSLASGVTGYLTYFRNITGNGGSSTSLTWKLGDDLYQVSVPIQAGEGGRQAALWLGRHMIRLTPSGVQTLIAKPFSATLTTGYQRPVTYTDTVTLQLAPATLPKRLNETLPNSDGDIYPPYQAGVFHGIGRGFIWRAEMTTGIAPSAQPVYKLSGLRVSGSVHPGGTVHISGTISPAPPNDTQLAINWPMQEAVGSIRTYPPNDALPWWGTPYNESFYPVPSLGLQGTHFNATVPIPEALYDQGVGPSAVNRWRVLTPGLYHPQIFMNTSQSNTVSLSVHVLPGANAILPAFQQGPYLLHSGSLPPVAAYNLAYYGLGEGTDATTVPLLLPAWAAGALDPYNVMGSFHFPLTTLQNVPGGYAAIQFQGHITERGGPFPKPWPADVSQAALMIFGVKDAENPYALQLAHARAQTVAMGSLTGMMYALPSGTLVTLKIDGVLYGIFAAHPATAADAVAMARSLTEINASAKTSPANAVLLYASLLRAAARNDQAGLSDPYSHLWAITQADPHRTPQERRLDLMLSHWAGVTAHVVSVQGSVVTVSITGLPDGTSSDAAVTARIAVDATGDLHLLSTSAVSHAESAHDVFGATLAPAKPLPILTGNTAQTAVGSQIPVVLVPFSSGVQMSKPTRVPTRVWAPIPTAVARQMAAYLYPLGTQEWAYVVAPRGLRGSAIVGADGSNGLTLSGPDASVLFSHAGGSLPMAEAAASPYFPAAGRALAENMGWSTTGLQQANAYLIQHASVRYEDGRRVALFAYSNAEGRSVYGYASYQPLYMGAFNIGAQFDFVTDRADRPLAPYVMQSALGTLQQIGAPQLSGDVVPMQTASVMIGQNRYRLPVPANTADSTALVRATPHGIAWISEPPMINTDPKATAAWQVQMALIPGQGYAINLSPRGHHADLTHSAFRTLAVVPPYELGAWTSQVWYATLALGQQAGPNWLLYDTSYKAIGMNQPAGNNLYAVNLQTATPNPVLVTSFFDAGGLFFSYGTYGPNVIYEQANDLDPQGRMIQHLVMVNLASGARTLLPTSDLHGDVVTLDIAGQAVHVTLSQASSAAATAATATTATRTMHLARGSGDKLMQPVHRLATRVTNAASSSVRMHLVPAHIIGQPTQEQYSGISFISPTDGWVSTGDDRLLHTTNGGQSWTTTTTGDLRLMILHFVNTNLGYALADVANAQHTADHAYAVVQTTDGGATWHILKEVAASTGQPSDLQLTYPAPLHLYVALGEQVIASDNGGLTWRNVQFRQPGWHLTSMSFEGVQAGWAIGIVPLPTKNRYAGNDRIVLLHTVNAGRTWSVDAKWTQPAQAFGSVSFVNAHDGWVTMGNTASMQDELWRTRDGGQRWSLLQRSLLNDGDPLGVEQPQWLTPDYGWIPDAMGAMPMPSGVDVTTDGGAHFTLVGRSKGRSAGQVDIVNREVGYVTGFNINDQFVLKTTDGGRTFTQILPAEQPTEGVHFLAGKLGYGLGDASDYTALLRTTDGGHTWKVIAHLQGLATNPDGTTLTFVDAAHGFIVAQNPRTDLQELLSTKDGGMRWAVVAPLPDHLYVSAQVGVLRFWSDSDGTLEIEGSDDLQYVYHTTDGGRTWHQATSTDWVGGLNWTDTWISPETVVGTPSADQPGPGESQTLTVQQSNNAGRSWHDLWSTQAVGAQIGTVDFISPSSGWVTVYQWPTDHGNQYLARLMATTADGRTWTAYAFPDLSSLWSEGGAQIDFVNRRDGWMLVAAGLLGTTDGGRAWTWLHH